MAGPIRVALEVGRAGNDERRLELAGAKVLGEPRKTLFHSVNARLEGPPGLQLTLFQRDRGPKYSRLPA